MNHLKSMINEMLLAKNNLQLLLFQSKYFYAKLSTFKLLIKGALSTILIVMALRFVFFSKDD